MAVTNNNANLTPGEVKKGEDVPSNLDAARPVIDRIKDIDAERAEETATGGGDTVIDNTPETAAENERAEAEAKKAEDEPKKAAKSETKRSTARE